MIQGDMRYCRSTIKNAKATGAINTYSGGITPLNDKTATATIPITKTIPQRNVRTKNERKYKRTDKFIHLLSFNYLLPQEHILLKNV
jgi:hypothetical protein